MGKGKVPKMAETRECICVGFLSGFREDGEPSFLLVLGPKKLKAERASDGGLPVDKF